MTTDNKQSPSTDVVLAESAAIAAPPVLRPAIALNELIAAKRAVDEVVQHALVEGRDYGTIAGTNRPTLLKPGAEQLAVYYGLRVRYDIVEREAVHDRPVLYVKKQKIWNNAHRGDKSFTWKVEEANSLGLYRYVVRCALIRRASEEVFGEALGSCSSMESKYVDRPRDVENTVLKMAQKRALIAAVLNALALSDRFTQDMEDVVENARASGDDAHLRPPASEPAPAVPTTYDEALAVRFPGSPEDWRGLGGSLLRQVTLKTVQTTLKWLDDPKQEKLAAKYPAFTAALRLVSANDAHQPEE